jgi:hypothetical protein
MVRVPQALALLLATLSLASPAAAYEHCRGDDVVCARYSRQGGDAHADVENDIFLAGAGEHDGAGPFNGTNAYFFTSTVWFAAYDGDWMNRDFMLVTAGVNGERVLFFQMDGRARDLPESDHCLEVGPGAMYKRCDRGLP